MTRPKKNKVKRNLRFKHDTALKGLSISARKMIRDKHLAQDKAQAAFKRGLPTTVEHRQRQAALHKSLNSSPA